MATNAQHAGQNNLLRQIGEADLSLLQPYLSAVELKLGVQLIGALELFEHAYFVTTGLVSVIATAGAGSHLTEVAIYGYEGMGSTAGVLGSDRCPYSHIVQIEGTALTIRSEHLKAALDKSSSLRSLLLRYVHTFNVQTAYTAVANSDFLVEQRLARWLLMCQDRVRSAHIHLTHDFIATMLSVRRAGVTDAIHTLEGMGIIQSVRGRITIRNRANLINRAGASYGIPEGEYRRLISPLDGSEPFK